MSNLDCKLEALSQLLKSRLGAMRFQLWFGGALKMERRGQQLVVLADTRFVLETVRRNIDNDLKECWRQVADSTEVLYDLRTTTEISKPVPEVRVVESAPVATTSDVAMPQSANPKVPSASAVKFRVDHQETWLRAASNRLATTAIERALEPAGRGLLTTIVGGAGVGKTHLMRAMASNARRRNPPLAALYLTAEQFTNGFVEALHGKGLPSFRRKHRGLDVLFLDDVHFFCSKRATLGEVGHTIESLLRDGKRVVLSADRAPDKLEGLGPEISTRIRSGVVCDIEAPDRELRERLLDRLIKEVQLELDANAIEWIVERLGADVRELHGALHRLKAHADAFGEALTLDVIVRVLADIAGRKGALVGLKEVEAVICDHFQIPAREMISKAKSRTFSEPRMLAMFLAREVTRAGLSEIGEHFGGRSHSTVIAASQRVKEWVDKGKTLRGPAGELPAEIVLKRLLETLRSARAV